jgi:hypothetical protein
MHRDRTYFRLDLTVRRQSRYTDFRPEADCIEPSAQ